MVAAALSRQGTRLSLAVFDRHGNEVKTECATSHFLEAPLLREPPLDARPAMREAAVSGGEFPDAVYMVKQQHDGGQVKRVFGLLGSDGLVQMAARGFIGE